MRAKKFLMQVKLCELHIQRKLEERKRVEAIATRITPMLTQDPVQHGDSDKISDCVIKMLEIENEINASIENYERVRREVDAVLDEMDNAQQLELITKRYFENKPFPKIAQEMYISESWVFTIHKKALDSIDGILERIENEKEFGTVKS